MKTLLKTFLHWQFMHVSSWPAIHKLLLSKICIATTTQQYNQDNSNGMIDGMAMFGQGVSSTGSVHVYLLRTKGRISDRERRPAPLEVSPHLN